MVDRLTGAYNAVQCATMNQRPYRAMREAAGLSLRELSRRTGWVEEGSSTPGHINPGRLSIIERGVEPSVDEAVLLNRLLGEALTGVSAT